MDDEERTELAEKVQAALRAIAEVSDALEDFDADEDLIDSCALSAESMESLATDLGYGVINGLLVPG